MVEKIQFGNFEANVNFLEDNNLLSKEDKILEIGSGKGVLLNYFIKKGYNIVGLELNDNFIKESKILFGNNLPIKKGEGTKLDFPTNCFDKILSFDVIEHIPDTNAHLREVKRVLKKKGEYLFGMPNKLTNIPFEVISQRSLNHYKKYHCSLHTLWGMKKRLRSLDFDVKTYNIQVMTKFILEKVKKNFGSIGLMVFKFVNPDKFPNFMRITLYFGAKK